MTVSRPVLLGGYAAKQCARRVHNEWDCTIVAEPLPVPTELQARFDAGREFEATVREAMVAALGDRCLVVDDAARRRDAVAETLRAMDDGMEVIIGGWLPDDLPGGRTGRPDILLRVSPVDDRPAFVAGDIKGHQSTKPAVHGTWLYSTLAQPSAVASERGRTARIADRLDDHVQVAHYARMLQACGRASLGTPNRGFIIGTESSPDPSEGPFALTWLDLDSPQFITFSRTQGTRKRSALERYDHEHGFRMLVADRARQRTGSPADPPPLVVPIVTDECDVCPWRDYCRDLIGPDAASAILQTGRLDIREWQALAGTGVQTAQDLANLDLDDAEWWAGYLPEVTHQARARDRLTVAVTRARMALAGVRLERTTVGPIAVPRADVEIDFDIEWDTDNRVFLWGALLTDAEHPEGDYIDFTDLGPLDGDTERALGRQFLYWLRNRIEQARHDGESVAVFHYSHPETSHLVRVFGEEEVADILPIFVDLLQYLRANFIGVAGLGIKQVAPEFGFHWRDDDPGGLQAQGWLAEARGKAGTARDDLVRRLLDYNEDDVRATRAVRHGLASQ
jgi:predicted RecB family nuclease